MKKGTTYPTILFLICSLSLFTPFSLFSQIANETPLKTKRILPVTEKKVPKLLPPKDNANPFLNNNPFTGGLEITDPKKKLDYPEKNPNEREKFLDAGEPYLSKLNRKGNKSENNRYGFKVDQYLGDVRNNGEFVEIIFRDHESPDGDRIKILLNDVVVIPDVMLMERFRSANIDLVEGFNKIDFVALNQGSSGPNTAEVRIYDDAGSLIASNRWNLATGVKATYIVVKE